MNITLELDEITSLNLQILSSLEEISINDLCIKAIIDKINSDWENVEELQLQK